MGPPIRLVKPWKDMFLVSIILTFGQQSREHNEQLRRYWHTEYPESAEVLSSPEIMENTVDSHSEKHAGQQKMTSLRTDVQRLLFYICKSHPRMRRLIYWQQETSCCHD